MTVVRKRTLRRRPRLVGESRFAPSIADYAHNLLVGTALRRLEERHLRRLESVELVISLARSGDDPLALPSGVEVSAARLRRGLRSYLAQSGRKQRPPAPSDPHVERNLALLGDLVGLDREDVAILRFLLAMKEDRELQEFTGIFGEVGTMAAVGLIAAATNLAEDVVLRALDRRSRLVESGLVSVEEAHCFELASKVEAGAVLLDLALAPDLDRDRIVATFLSRAAAPTLEWADFAHLRAPAELARDLLRAALRDGRAGVNLLFHGETGTGKTELARLLALDLGAALYAAGLTDRRGESPTGRERLSSLLLGQRLLSGEGHELLLFDEMEDLRAWGGKRIGILGDRSGADVGLSKQWFNEHLETNPVPTIWITNDPSAFDTAYLRRFTYAIEFRPLGARQRARVLSRHARDRLAPLEVDAIAQRFEASPGQLASAVAAAASIEATGRPARAAIEALLAPVERLVSGRDPAHRPIFDAGRYRIDAASSTADLGGIAERLAAWEPGPRPGISLCLYGPPGTGKSEWVHYLAHRMGRPVVRRLVSDLASKWVGETEQRIAQAFRQAEEDGAVLLFDEADSFLRERQRSTQAWEVTQVNEFLQQLESFRGVVACTTNLWRELDEACLRRFVFKLEFGFLGTEQALLLLRQVLSELETPMGTEEEADARRELSRLVSLTPGDFAAVERRERALGSRPSVAGFVNALRGEVEARRAAPRAIGF